MNIWLIICTILLCYSLCECRVCDELPPGTKCPVGCDCCLRNSHYDDPNLTINCNKAQTDAAFVDNLSTLLKVLKSMKIFLTRFALSGVRLESIPSEICAINSVEELILVNLKLPSVSSECFRNLTKLTVLSLNGNELVSLPDDLFYGLHNLVSIQFAYNKLENVQPELFMYINNTSKLNEVDFSYNRLTSLDIWPTFLRTNDFAI
jgi:Leucine-rich repeat (LRR) protein